MKSEVNGLTVGGERVSYKAGADSVQVLPEGVYECVRCRTKAMKEELDGLPSPRCARCGFTVFQKARPATVKTVAAA